MKSVKYHLKIISNVIILIFYSTDKSLLHGMLVSKSNTIVKTATKRAATLQAQKRNLYTPEKLKGLYVPLTSEAKNVAPLHGAIGFSTNALLNRYQVNSEEFGPQLVKELFFQQGSQFKPTVSKSKAGYSLSPGILGLVIGALETGRLQEHAVRNYIIDEWRNEYRKITDDKTPFSRGKIERLLTLIENEYKNDKDSCRSILLSFLYAKALPDNDHDMIHYLAGLNEFMQVFVDDSSPAAKSVKTYMTEKKGIMPPEPTFFERLQLSVQAMKNYISGSSDSSNTYKQKDYDNLKKILQKTDRSEAVKQALTKNFELTVSAMLNELNNTSLYPPQVIQSAYGYKKKRAAPDCVETTIHDLLNIMLYNPQIQEFDLSLLPSTLTLNEHFKQFYTDYRSPSKINTAECGQAFMNLVSGLETVFYKRDDYELKASESEKKLIALANYFFGINVQSLDELGMKLSDERRAITFIMQEGYPISKIIMTIKNKQTNTELQAIFKFSYGHGEAEVPERNNQRINKSLFTPKELAQNYKINPEVRTLLRIDPIELTAYFLPEQLSQSFYYTLPVETDSDKIAAIIYTRNMGTDNIDREAFDYVLHLYQQLSLPYQERLFPTVFDIGYKKEIQYFDEKSQKTALQNDWHSNIKFEKFVIDNHALFLDKIILNNEDFIKYADLIQELYEKIPDEYSKYAFFLNIVKKIAYLTKINSLKKSGIEHSMLTLLPFYNKITNSELKRKFLADFLLILAQYNNNNNIDWLDIVKYLIDDGADLNGIANENDKESLINLNKNQLNRE